MNRREFLKLSGMTSAFVLASLSPISVLAKSPAESETAAVGGKLYRGARNGNIYVSQNGGKTWKLHTGFGPNCPILGMTVAANGQPVAHVGFKQYSFRMALSKDGTVWRV
ncbi:MAG: hypothetical protein WA821_21825 [Anaerolineales bacterium]